jgi:hypothetical protein
MVKVYLNSDIGINICVINNPDKIEMNTIRKPSDLFSKNYRGLGPYRPLVYNNSVIITLFD